MITKITPYKLSWQSYEHRVLVALDYNPDCERVLVSLNNTIAEGIFNPKTKNIMARVRAVMPAKVRELPINPDIRVKVFVYDFLQDKIIEAKLQEFAFCAEAFHYEANNLLLDTPKVIMDSSDALINNFWLF